MPGESHPLKALLAVLRAAAADELEEVISLQVAGLLPPQLAWWITQVDRWKVREVHR